MITYYNTPFYVLCATALYLLIGALFACNEFRSVARLLKQKIKDQEQIYVSDLKPKKEFLIFAFLGWPLCIVLGVLIGVVQGITWLDTWITKRTKNLFSKIGESLLFQYAINNR